MTGALLRTGDLKAFEPLGALGSPVYLAAPQLRAALGRHLGAKVAGTLAIPRRNQDGDTIDWYAPVPGAVVPWSAATPEERAQARDLLLAVKERIEDLGRAMQSDEAGERQTFGHLLGQVTSFPGEDHIYLVDGQPVVTFWGFRRQNAPVGSSPMLSAVTEPPSAPVESKSRGLSWWWLVPLFLASALLLFWLLRGCQEPPSPPVDERPEQSLPQPPASAKDDTASPQQPAGEDVPEPLPDVARDRPERAVHRGGTRILERDGIAIEHSRVDSEAVEVERISGDAVESAVVSEELESTGIVDAGAAGTQIEADGVDTLAEQPSDSGMGVEDIGPETGEPERSEETSATAAPDTPEEEAGDALEPASQPPPEKSPADPQQTDEPPLPAAATDGESPSGEQPNEGVPSPKPTPGPAVSEGSEGQGESGEPQIPVQGAKPEPSKPRQEDAAQSRALSPETVGATSAQFLNGGWRTSTSLQDPRTALPVDMEYRLRNGSGTLSLRRSDGSVCKGQVKAVIENGKLVVHNAQDIRCPDGTNFGRPRLECTPGKDGRADCSGRYETGEEFSVDIKKSE